jgi:molybdopterin-guanine dinucleotide biosynthesis protein A
MRVLPDAPAIAVLACDLVAPSAPAIREVVLALGATSADVVVPVVDDQPEWLHAVWRASALNGLRAAFAAGDRAIHTAAERVDVAFHHGLDPSDVADADRPEDLRR